MSRTIRKKELALRNKLGICLKHASVFGSPFIPEVVPCGCSVKEHSNQGTPFYAGYFIIFSILFLYFIAESFLSLLVCL